MRCGHFLQIASVDAKLRWRVRARIIWIGLLCAQAALAQTHARPLAGKVPTVGEPESRARLHHCAAEWVRMKKNGEAAGKIWRDFWEVCGKK